jgi:Arc/MetJ family transcription regulator
MTTTAQSGRRKTTIEIDVDLLSRAQEILGTKGVKETIDKALEEVWRAEMRRRLMEDLRAGRWDFEHNAIDREAQWRTR